MAATTVMHNELTGVTLSTTAALIWYNKRETNTRRKRWKCFPQSKSYGPGQIV